MRGKVPLVTSIAIVMGITPAYAGKSSREAIFFNPALGSPPPMRGKAPSTSFSARSIRITPAYAGKRCQLEVFT